MNNHDQILIDQFNLKHPVKSKIQYRHEDGTIKEGIIRAAAELFMGADHIKFSYDNPAATKTPDRVPCVYIEKRYDAIHLKDVVK